MADQKTTLDDDNTKPSRTVAGDGPHDTTDPLEQASTVIPNPGPDALRAGTVNAVRKLAPIPAPEGRRRGGRIVEHDATLPNGETVRVAFNVDTGESRPAGGTDTGSVPTQSGR